MNLEFWLHNTLKTDPFKITNTCLWQVEPWAPTHTSPSPPSSYSPEKEQGNVSLETADCPAKHTISDLKLYCHHLRPRTGGEMFIICGLHVDQIFNNLIMGYIRMISYVCLMCTSKCFVVINSVTPSSLEIFLTGKIKWDKFRDKRKFASLVLWTIKAENDGRKFLQQVFTIHSKLMSCIFGNYLFDISFWDFQSPTQFYLLKTILEIAGGPATQFCSKFQL